MPPNQVANKMIDVIKDFETSRINSIKRNNKIAWIVSGISLLVTVLAIGAVFLMTPLKTVEPYVIRVDNATGATDIVYSLKETTISKDEQMDRYWLRNYVTFRESYDWYNVQTNYDTAMIMSGAAEQKILFEFFQGNVAPYKVFKNDFRVEVKINSITYVGELAQVRFEKRVKDLKDPNKAPTIQNLIATIGYRYINEKLPQEERLINPLGFKVESYKIDTEY